MSYILYHKTHGVVIMFHQSINLYKHKPNDDFIAIPCIDTDDINDTEKWTNLANDIINNGYPIDLVKQWKINELMTEFEQTFEQINSTYPQGEREGWTIQENEARIYLKDTTQNASIVAPVLYGLVQERNNNESVEELANKVLYNAHLNRVLYVKLVGKQQKMYKEINALTNTSDVENYVIKFPTINEIMSQLEV